MTHAQVTIHPASKIGPPYKWLRSTHRCQVTPPSQGSFSTLKSVLVTFGSTAYDRMGNPNAASSSQPSFQKQADAKRTLEAQQDDKALSDTLGEPRPSQLQEERTQSSFVAVSKKERKKQRKAGLPLAAEAEQEQFRKEAEALAKRRQQTGKGQHSALEEAADAFAEKRYNERLGHIADLHGLHSYEARGVLWSRRTGQPEYFYDDDDTEQRVEADSAYAARVQQNINQFDQDMVDQEVADKALAETLQQELKAEEHSLRQQQVLAEQHFTAEQQNKRRTGTPEATHVAKQVRLAKTARAETHDTATPMDEEPPAERLDDILAYDDIDSYQEERAAQEAANIPKAKHNLAQQASRV